MEGVVKTYKGISATAIEAIGLCVIVVLVAWILMTVELVIKWLLTDIATATMFAKHLLLSQLALLPSSHCDASYCHPLSEISNWNQRLIEKAQNISAEIIKISHKQVKVTQSLSASSQKIDIPSAMYWVKHGLSQAGIIFSFIWLAFEIILTKFMVMILALPMLILSAFMGLVDGLVMRDIRKMGVGRESTFLFHAVKKKLYPTILTFIFIFMLLPMPITPMLIIFPLALAITMLTAVSASRFKKYV